MNQMPVSLRPGLRRLARRLAIGLFLDVWPRWAVGSLLVAGLAALVCRMFVPGASSSLYWLWLAPVLSTVPAHLVCFIRSYRPAEVLALAEWLSGGHGAVLTLSESNDAAWADSRLFGDASRFMLPRLAPWRRLAGVLPALAFLAAALWLPQRIPPATSAVLADEIAADLTATLTGLKQQELVTPAEEEKLEEEIERIRRGAEERVDASSWEAADALREKVAAGLSEKQDAVKWAEESLARYAAAAEAGSLAGSGAEAQAAELTKALETLAQSGLLAGAPADLQQLLKAGKLPGDAKSLSQLAATLSKYLAGTRGRFGELASLGKEFGRFDPAEFPLACDASVAVCEKPGRSAVTRGRADAPLTWGKESAPFDRFKAQALPPGAPRSPDDWAPVVELPGAPRESPTLSGRSTSRQYAATAGQTAWRRTLAPRHERAVRKYFEKD
jgi:hypothetical protein